MLKTMKTLLMEVSLYEMAKMYGGVNKFVSNITSNGEINQQLYSTFSKLPILHRGDDGIDIHAGTSRGNEYYATIDNMNKRMLHITILDKLKADPVFPHDRLEQSLVDKDSNHPKTSAPGYARSFAYDHWSNQHLPFRSSHEQALGGHKMWLKYAKQALSDGKRVYFHSPSTGFVKVTNDTLDEYHKKYYGNTNEHSNMSLVLSHSELM